MKKVKQQINFKLKTSTISRFLNSRNPSPVKGNKGNNAQIQHYKTMNVYLYGLALWDILCLCMARAS